MKGFTNTVTIACPADEVWTRLTDWEQAPRWMTGIERCRAPDGLGVGRTLKFMSRGAERESLVKELVDGQRLVLESTQGPVVATYTYSCTPRDGGTELTLQAVCRGRGSIRLVMPLIRYMMKRVDSGQPQALKRLVEARG